MMPPITTNLLDIELNSQWQQQLLPLWQLFVHGDLQSSDQTRLSYSYYLVKPARQAVVFSTGRVEMAVKYIELMQEFITAGYSVFILDHRGQGQSARLHSDLQLGYVVDFQDYVDDFNQFVSEVVQPFGHQQHLLLAHSMGAAIACRYLQQQPHQFNAAIFGSPMFGISAGALPTTLAYKFISAYGWFRSQLKLSNQHYFPGQTPYLDKPFANNLLTHSPHRYKWLRQLYQLYPESQLGGVSWAWLTQAIKAMAWLQQNAVEFNVPILLLQAAEDKVVSNNAQTRWFNRLPAPLYKQHVLLAGAYHEIWMEKDTIRQQAITAVNRFLADLP
jgi:lysophospholipase